MTARHLRLLLAAICVPACWAGFTQRPLSAQSVESAAPAVPEAETATPDDAPADAANSNGQPAETPSSEPAPATSAGSEEVPATAEPAAVAAPSSAPLASPAAGPHSDVEFDPQVFRVIRHHTLGISSEEGELYYSLLAHIRETGYRAQKEQAARNVARHRKEFAAQPGNARRKYSLFVDSFRNPEKYTGQLVPLRGYLRKLESFEADKNPYGIKRLYEGWLYTEDSQSNPAVVVFLEKPKGMPEGLELLKEEHVDRVEVSGHFFKMYVYQAQDGMRQAPLFLAQRLEWYPLPKTGSPIPWVWVGVLAALVLALIAVLWRVGRRDREMRRQLRQKEAAIDTQELGAIASAADRGMVFFPPDDTPPAQS